MIEDKEVRDTGKTTRSVLIFSVIVNIILASFTGYFFQLNTSQKNQIDELTNTINETMESIRFLELQLNMSTTQLDYYMELADFYSNQTTSQNGASSLIGESTIPIVALQTIRKGFNVEYKGVVMEAEVDLVEGDGRVLVNTVPMIGIDI